MAGSDLYTIGIAVLLIIFGITLFLTHRWRYKYIRSNKESMELKKQLKQANERYASETKQLQSELDGYKRDARDVVDVMATVHEVLICGPIGAGKTKLVESWYSCIPLTEEYTKTLGYDVYQFLVAQNNQPAQSKVAREDHYLKVWDYGGEDADLANAIISLLSGKDPEGSPTRLEGVIIMVDLFAKDNKKAQICDENRVARTLKLFEAPLVWNMLREAAKDLKCVLFFINKIDLVPGEAKMREQISMSQYDTLINVLCDVFGNKLITYAGSVLEDTNVGNAKRAFYQKLGVKFEGLSDLMKAAET